MSALIVIPARLASSRLPEKLLQKVGGKSVLHHTYVQATQSRVAQGVVVAVDHQRLADEVEQFGGKWIMTSESCASGTDRIAEVAAAMPDVDVFVNVQGDEPEIDPATIDAVAQLLLSDSQADMATVGVPLRNADALADPNQVKIVMGTGGRAVTFSRAAVPFARDGVSDELLNAEPPIFWHHVGLYAYRREFLDWFCSQPPSPLETTEKLEQLRAIEAGKRIVVTRVESNAAGIDTSTDLEAFRVRFANA
ncbi:3-deoxy-manno-octulosonate cytidylyltransferase [Rubripirellula amarantea]|uniref:3-deoxy-manno-octulosonate cytidylyltransferase n=1 Tax=Rubripirellula amarantea TaxID=2527999 RepID=A0A5C5WQS4_9BACT|nr:3-deoxy-manno-octulosonate cytidylyltransferase [Rubripirellula amarantea]TWT53244.1 3-deoxy-manno-octulosonate cytidylyltransferase [Rubripirellula amarantea]